MNATLPNPISEVLEPPSMPGEWSLKQIQSALSRPLPKQLLATRKKSTFLSKILIKSPYRIACRGIVLTSWGNPT